MVCSVDVGGGPGAGLHWFAHGPDEIVALPQNKQPGNQLCELVCALTLCLQCAFLLTLFSVKELTNTFIVQCEIICPEQPLLA